MASNDALGGENFAVLRLEAAFPLGLPEEYGLSGGLFYDIGNLWSLKKVNNNRKKKQNNKHRNKRY